MSSHMNFIPNLCSSIRNNAMNVKASTWKGPCLHNHSICVWAWIQTWWPPNQKKKSLKTSGKFGIAEDGILVHPKCIKSKICANLVIEVARTQWKRKHPFSTNVCSFWCRRKAWILFQIKYFSDKITSLYALLQFRGSGVLHMFYFSSMFTINSFLWF